MFLFGNKQVLEKQGAWVYKEGFNSNKITVFSSPLELEDEKTKIIYFGELAIMPQVRTFENGYHDIDNRVWIYPFTSGLTIARFHYRYSAYPILRRLIDEIAPMPIKLACCSQHLLDSDLAKYALFPKTEGFGRMYWYKEDNKVKCFYSYYLV